MTRLMKVGDLVRLPTSNRPRGVLGVVVDLATRADEGLVGISWPDTEGLVYEKMLMLDVLG